MSGRAAVRDFIRILVVITAAGLLGACGGVGTGAAENGGTDATAPAAAVVGGWDSWDWDAGAWSE